MGIWKAAWQIMTGSVAFFENMGDEDLGKALKYYAVLAIPAAILNALLTFNGVLLTGWLSLVVLSSLNLGAAQVFIGVALSVIMMYLLLLLAVFIGGAIVWLLLRMVGARGSYARAFELTCCAQTPTVLYGWIPLIGGFASLWSVVLLVIGAQKRYGISAMRAVVAFIVLPGAGFMGILALVFALGMAGGFL